MAHNFKEFVDRKGRQERKELGILKSVLEKQGFKVADHTEGEEPYIFVRSHSNDLSFEGIRVYKIGDSMAFRVQKEADTHPYGKAYKLDIEDMYHDFLSDEMDEAKAGKQVMESLAKEIKHFFEQSAKAESEIRQKDFEDKDALGKVVIKSTGTDYSQLVHSKG